MEKNFEEDAPGKINATLNNIPLFPVPKGEVWLGTDLLKQAGFTDSLENHFSMADRLGQEMVCLPVTDNTISKPSLGYRYFECADLKKAVQIGGRFIAAVVDGPFQELVNSMGLMNVLMGWARDRSQIIKAYEKEQTRILDLISQCLDMGVQGIILTDDLAADQGPMISPKDIEMLCTRFYRESVNNIHNAGLPVFLHSCGKIKQLTKLIRSWQIDGLAAVQHSINNLPELRDLMGPNHVIMAGIDAPLLATELSEEMVLEFTDMLKAMTPGGCFILSSSCGLYSGDFLDRIKKIYTLADHVTPLHSDQPGVRHI
ncbi:putative uroporphyrinogen-III decarboxylase [Desulforapulum autotrophicum HRM2]|uniref:Uroporphyrinogen-III decarboxylase n=1 Tax=Desulforapulum autotrophicum (strain ATCC 43914 / DSM 3382 / VKM B-1955 / HRM2) TaxID=177437 RepID=C0QBF0_DESAH|nr:uroporphyrinogen decarboxylase family protein [Desulforapulum autotrophicum]ACN16952.1 putative uroporphyrinogen-III decarboxylase [Desulforapulum autotrophicum HRM2]